MPVRRRAPRRKHRKVRRGRARAGRGASKQMARIVETIEFPNMNPDTPNVHWFNLSEFPRAANVAPNFRWYRAKKVTWCIDAQYNTFQETTTGTGVTIPYMYVRMNRAQDSGSFNGNDLIAMGAKPQKLIGRKIITYKPNWCSPGLLANNYYTGGSGTVGADPV